MKLFLLYLLLLIDFTSAAQNNIRIPQAETFSSSSIAVYIQKIYAAENERIAAAYNWITQNIRYDTDSLYYFNWNCDHDTRVAATLRRRKGVCENYAALFSDILSKMNIQSFVVHGYTKPAANNGHAWVAVKENNDWYLCDPTWDAGNKTPKYLMIKPDLFIETHMPFDPLWQLLEYPCTHKDFARGYQLSVKNKAPVMYKDSVELFLTLDSMQRFEAANRRMASTGLTDKKMQQWHAYNSMKIAIIRGEKYMFLYNNAVENINKATASLNAFLQYRNRQFRPEKPEQEIRMMLDDSEDWLLQAGKSMVELSIAKDNFQYSPDGLFQQKENLARKIKQQQQFLKNYFAIPAPQRARLFYKD